jgi:hypothetical protein
LLFFSGCFISSRLKNRLLFAVGCWAVAVIVTGNPLCAHADPAILNGSFEDPGLSPDTLSAGGGTSWTPNGGNVFIVSNNFDNLGITPYGSQYLGFTQSGASDQQAVAGFLAGQNYVLDLFFADIAGNADPQLTVMITGAANASGVFDAPVSGPNGNAPYPFQEVQVPFTTTADGDVTFLLIDSGAASLAVDNVSIAPVPEPSSTLTLLLVGAATAAWSFRLRRRSV